MRLTSIAPPFVGSMHGHGRGHHRRRNTTDTKSWVSVGSRTWWCWWRSSTEATSDIVVAERWSSSLDPLHPKMNIDQLDCPFWAGTALLSQLPPLLFFVYGRRRGKSDADGNHKQEASRMGIDGVWDGKHTGSWRTRKWLKEEKQHRRWWWRIRRGKAPCSDNPIVSNSGSNLSCFVST